MRDHSLAYYDAQIWASVRLNQMSVVFSNGQVMEGLRFVNPFSEQFRLKDWVCLAPLRQVLVHLVKVQQPHPGRDPVFAIYWAPVDLLLVSQRAACPPAA